MNRSWILMASLLFGAGNSQIVQNSELYTYPCQNEGPSALYASFDACYNTPGCQMPYCCGLIAGRPFNASFTYLAAENVPGGTVKGIITGVTFTTPTQDPLSLSLALPVPLAFPPLLSQVALQLNPDMCYNGPNNPWNANFCPQTAGNQYTFNGLANAPLSITTSATVILQVKFTLTYQEQRIFCSTQHVRFVSPALEPLLSSLGLGIGVG